MSDSDRTKFNHFNTPQSSILMLPQVSQFPTISDLPCGGHLKRMFDFTMALIACVLLAPLLFGLALAIHLSDGGPAFF